MNWSPPEPLVSDPFELALRMAAVGHNGQIRRASSVPYLTHPVAVARLVERAGFAETVVVAALLHDVTEDTPTTIAEIEGAFGAAVAEIVAGCSEVKTDAEGRPRPWEDRKRDHLDELDSASLATRAVVLADKLHNLQSIRLDLQAGRPVWDHFHAARERVLWYFGAAIDRCAGADPELRDLATAARRQLGEVSAWPEKPESSSGTT